MIEFEFISHLSTKEKIPIEIKVMESRSNVIFVALFFVLIIVVYMFFWSDFSSRHDKEKQCNIIKTENYPSPGNQYMAKLEHLSCNKEGHREYEVIVWLSRVNTDGFDAAVFIGHPEGTRIEAEKSPHYLQLQWVGNSSLSIRFPQRMRIFSKPGNTYNVNVSYMPIQEK